MRTAPPNLVTLARPLTLVALAALLVVLMIPARVMAQGESPADLRRENDTLRNRVAQLEASNQKLADENERLQKRTAQLESQLARLQAEMAKLRAKPGDDSKGDADATGGAGGAGGADDTDATADLPADPLACPPSLLKALKTKYQEQFAKKQITEQNKSDYIKDVRRWALDMKREFRGNVTWTVEIQSADVPGDEKLPVKLRVVDPDTHKPFHTNPVAVDLGYRNTRRVMAEPNATYWVVEGIFFADPDVNPDRQSPGSMDYPKLIGPFAEFNFGLSVRTIMPAESKPTP